MGTRKFADLIRRVRAGDADAARILVAEYESVVRVTIRYRMTDPRLRSALDSADICQSVFGSFFIQAAHGSFDLRSPKQLAQLLVGITRNKIAEQARRLSAKRRDFRRASADKASLDNFPDGAPTPSRYAEGKELLGEVWRRFTPVEREVAVMRQQGLDWETIAKELHDKPILIRKRYSRAIDRVARELGLNKSAIGML
jgi:RNA polymerase sigma factor (sigma-70 family)